MNHIKQFFRLAAIISALPNTISNGQTADAVPLMADLNHIVNQVNANAAESSAVALLAAANSFTAVQSGLTATASSNFPTAGQVQGGALMTLTSAAGANTITANAALSMSALTTGQVFTFLPESGNSGAVTINPNAIGAQAISKDGTRSLTSEDLVTNRAALIRYDGLGTGFQYLNYPTYSRGASLATGSSVDLNTVNGDFFHFTGNATINQLLLRQGRYKEFVFDGSAVLMSGAALIVPGSANYTATANDVFGARGDEGGIARITKSQKADGTAVASSSTVYQSAIAGLTYANGTDAVNDINIAAGQCTDATNAFTLTLASTLVKQLDAAWAVGTNAGGLDTGVIGDSDYYIWLIKRSDTSVVDALFSLSSTAPTMPASYDQKRLIGWFKRVAGTIVAFSTHETDGGGLNQNWAVPTLDVNLASTLTTSGRTDAVKVPLNLVTKANLNVVVAHSSAANIWIYSPDHTSAAPSATAAPLANISRLINLSFGTNQIEIVTSSTGTIGARSDVATVDSYLVSTMGFTWSRR